MISKKKWIFWSWILKHNGRKKRKQKICIMLSSTRQFIGYKSNETNEQKNRKLAQSLSLIVVVVVVVSQKKNSNVFFYDIIIIIINIRQKSKKKKIFLIESIDRFLLLWLSWKWTIMHWWWAGKRRRRKKPSSSTSSSSQSSLSL